MRHFKSHVVNFTVVEYKACMVGLATLQTIKSSATDGPLPYSIVSDTVYVSLYHRL